MRKFFFVVTTRVKGLHTRQDSVLAPRFARWARGQTADPLHVSAIPQELLTELRLVASLGGGSSKIDGLVPHEHGIIRLRHCVCGLRFSDVAIKNHRNSVFVDSVSLMERWSLFEFLSRVLLQAHV